MRTHLPRTHAHESAAGDWISSREPNEDRDHDRDGLLREGFRVGAEWADGEFAIERSTGQQQLDDAAALMREAVALLRHEEWTLGLDASRHPEGEEFEKAMARSRSSALMAQRLEAWLAGESIYPITPGGEYVAHAHFRQPCRVTVPDGGFDLVDDKTVDDCRSRFANFAGSVSLSATMPDSSTAGGVLFFGSDTGPYTTSALGSGELVVDALPPQSSGVVNVKPVTHGLLADPVVVEGLMAASGMIDATVPLAMETATAFRLQTGDPRFNPQEPVVVNGFLYRPATEK